MGISKRIGLSGVDSVRSDNIITWNHHAPATHGMLQIDLTTEDGLVTSAQPVLGSMHRGAEKLFESRDYRQVLGLANRHEWLSAFSGEVGVALLIERELGIDVPESAQWLRTLLLEVFRVSSHLAFIAGYPWGDDQITSSLRQTRENIVLHMRSYSGSRMHPMLTQIGGLTHAPTAQWLTELINIGNQTSETLRGLSIRIESELTPRKHFGGLTAEHITAHAVSGPVARASGVVIDIRLSTPQLKYAETSSFASHTQDDGDVFARIIQLCDEVTTSCAMISELADKSQQHIHSDVNVLTPKVLRVPEGEYEASIETPLGIASWLLVSRGDKYPYRLALRPASLHTVLSLSQALIGHQESEISYIVASLPFITGDADR